MHIPFPTALDNSMINEFRSCPQAFFRAYMQHWKPQTQSVHLHAGAAFAAGLEGARKAYFENGVPAAVPGLGGALDYGRHVLSETYGDFDCPPESAKSRERMLQAYDFYLSDEWAMGADKAKPILLPSGKRAIEFSFAEPLPIDHPETGDPLLYVGRSDMVVSFAQGTFIEDDKTTSQLGASWANQWELRAQFSGYVWAARRMGYQVDGVLIRGVAILKTMFKRAQHITYRMPWEIERWERETAKTVKRMIEAWRAQDWDYNLGEACSSYGGCQFLKVCKHPTPDEWMPAFFAKRRWDPITREETVVE